jgi:hypothetical protein
MRGSSRVLFENLCLEFETAWDAMATTDRELRTGGSFLFARQAMLLVELATTVARTDADTLQRFSEELFAREPALFKLLPYTTRKGTRNRVPRLAPSGDPRSELIEVLFDLVRHGHAHVGHQVYAPLKDGGAFGVVLHGVWTGRTIENIRPPGGRHFDHLLFRRQSNGQLVVEVCAGTLYLDARDASEAARVWELELNLSSFTVARRQDVTIEDLVSALNDRTGPFVLVAHPSERDPAEEGS